MAICLTPDLRITAGGSLRDGLMQTLSSNRSAENGDGETVRGLLRSRCSICQRVYGHIEFYRQMGVNGLIPIFAGSSFAKSLPVKYASKAGLYLHERYAT